MLVIAYRPSEFMRFGREAFRAKKSSRPAVGPDGSAVLASKHAGLPVEVGLGYATNQDRALKACLGKFA